jgi:hypothetical protein
MAVMQGHADNETLHAPACKQPTPAKIQSSCTPKGSFSENQILTLNNAELALTKAGFSS